MGSETDTLGHFLPINKRIKKESKMELKHYLVQCILFRPMTVDSLRCIDVWAESIEDAKIRAVAILRARGYPDAFVAPEIEEIPIVIELDPKSTMMVGMP